MDRCDRFAAVAAAHPRWQSVAVRRVVQPLVDECTRAWRLGGPPVRAAATVGLGLMLVGLAHGVAFVVAGGAWEGPVAWRKPFAFGLSFGLTAITVAWMVTRLDIGRRAAWLLLTPVALAATVEVAWVTVQRARGVPSHFNDGSPADELAFILAGGVAVGVMAIALVVVFGLSWRRPASPPALTSAIRAGLAILLLSQALGGLMIQRGIASLDAGGPATHAIAPAGDLKVSHALAMHAIQVLPALALWLMAAERTSASARIAVRLVALGYAGVVAASLAQAAVGRSVTDPAPVSLVLAAAAALLVLAGIGLFSRLGSPPSEEPSAPTG